MYFIQNYIKEIKLKLFYCILSFLFMYFIFDEYNYEILELLTTPLQDNETNSEALTTFYSKLTNDTNFYFIFIYIISILHVFPYALLNIYIYMTPLISKIKFKKYIKNLICIIFYITFLNIIFNSIILLEIIDNVTENQNFNDNDDFNLIIQINLENYIEIIFVTFLMLNIIIIFPL